MWAPWCFGAFFIFAREDDTLLGALSFGDGLAPWLIYVIPFELSFTFLDHCHFFLVFSHLPH
jgi:hypothetical protein